MTNNLCEYNNINVCVIGIGYHGKHATAFMMNHAWFDGLPFNYLTVDDNRDCLNYYLIDERVFREKHHESIFGNWHEERDCIFVVTDLENDALVDQNASVVQQLNRPGKLIITFIIDPESNSVTAAFQGRVAKLIAVSKWVIVCSEKIYLQSDDQSQLPAKTGSSRQYEASASFIYGIISCLFHRGVFGIDFYDIKNIFEPGNDVKTVFVIGKGKDRAQLVIEKALFMLQQQGVIMCNAVSIMANIVHSEDFLWEEFDVIGKILHSQVSQTADLKAPTTLTNDMQPGELGILVLVATKINNL